MIVCLLLFVCILSTIYMANRVSAAIAPCTPVCFKLGKPPSGCKLLNYGFTLTSADVEWRMKLDGSKLYEKAETKRLR
jgi:hypothetical protein